MTVVYMNTISYIDVHMQCSDVRRCRCVCGIVGIHTYIARPGGLGVCSPRENLSFRLYKVVSEAILDHTRLILTLK